MTIKSAALKSPPAASSYRGVIKPGVNSSTRGVINAGTKSSPTSSTRGVIKAGPNSRSPLLTHEELQSRIDQVKQQAGTNRDAQLNAVNNTVIGPLSDASSKGMHDLTQNFSLDRFEGMNDWEMFKSLLQQPLQVDKYQVTNKDVDELAFTSDHFSQSQEALYGIRTDLNNLRTLHGMLLKGDDKGTQGRFEPGSFNRLKNIYNQAILQDWAEDTDLTQKHQKGVDLDVQNIGLDFNLDRPV